MRVTVNGEAREISSASVDALLAELEYEGTHFAIALNYDVLPARQMGRHAAEERRRDRDHHAAAGRVRMDMHRTLTTSSRRTPGPITTGSRGYERYLRACHNEAARRMGPGVRRDDSCEFGRRSC